MGIQHNRTFNYHALATSDGYDAYPNDWLADGRYRHDLRVASTDGTERATADLAQTTSTSASVALGGQLRSKIDKAGDVDWIKAVLTAGQSYAIELNADTSDASALANPVFKGVYDSAGKLIANTGNDDYGIGQNARTTFTPITSGNYYLAASGYGTTTGAYVLRLLSTGATADDAGNGMAGAAALTVGTPQTGTIEVARDADWYRIHLAAGQDYAIKVRGQASGSGTLADPDLIGIYDAAGVLIAGTGNDNGAQTLDAQSQFRPLSSGVYYIAVDAGNDGTGSYKLSVETAAPSNDLPANSTTGATLAAGATLASDIGVAGDVDWIRVALNAGQTYQIDLKSAPSTGGALGDPNIVGVYDAAGLVLPASADNDGGYGVNAKVTLTAPRTGDYFIAVNGYGGTTGTYKLSMTAAAGDTTAPTLLATDPADNTGAVQPGANLTLTFSEAVRASAGNILLSGGGVTRTIAVTDTSQVSFNGSSMTINPNGDLAADTDYSVRFPTGTVRDTAGNAFAGLSDAAQFNFHTTGTASSAADNWTIMVYMAGDNNLEDAAIADLNEMEAVALPASVNLVALLDRAPGYDTSNGNWTDTRSGAVVHDSSRTTIGSKLTSLGELDTGKSATLTNFINASVAANPASHFALIVWDHGGGLAGTCWDDSSGGDNLTLAEMREAVDASVVPKFDLIGFDACLQGIVDQAWDLRDLADVMVASQELEPGDGWEYDKFLPGLAQNPDLSATDLANSIVTSYGQRYAGEASITMSAVRTAALADLRGALDGFTSTAIAAGSGIVAQLLTAAKHSATIDNGDEGYRDLNDFMHQIAATVTSAEVKAAALGVSTALQNAVMSHAGTVAGAGGLSVYLPLAQIDASYVSASYQFLQSTTWGNLLRFMLNDQRADLLQGDALNNDLRGFAGNDTLIGGAGQDRLAGGAGNDKFVYSAVSDSGVTSATWDVITDFAAGDKIDLSALDANTALVGDQAFAAPVVGAGVPGAFTTAGALYFDSVAHVLYGNTNATPAAEFAIQLSGVATLSSLDIIA
jgi:methionine-rich copper-binding protein CopC